MIVRGPRPAARFTVLGNDLLRDSRLSFRARGLLAYVLSMPDNYRVSSHTLARAALEGRHAVLTALEELRAYGYATTVTRRSDDGRITTVTVVYDTPHPSGQREPDLDGDHVGNHVFGVVDNSGTGVRLPDPGKSDSLKRTEPKKTRRESVDRFRVGRLGTCGECDGTGLRPDPWTNDLDPCPCAGGVIRG